MQTKTVQTPLGELTITPVPMGHLKRGEYILGPTGTTEGGDGRGHPATAVYRVTDDCQSNDRHWLYVINLTPTPGAEPHGFFTYALDTPMNKVIEIREV